MASCSPRRRNGSSTTRARFSSGSMPSLRASRRQLDELRDHRRRPSSARRGRRPSGTRSRACATSAMVRPGDRGAEGGAEDQHERRQQDDGQRAGALQQHHGDERPQRQGHADERCRDHRSVLVVGPGRVAGRGCGPVARRAARTGGRGRRVSATPPASRFCATSAVAAVVARSCASRSSKVWSTTYFGAVDQVDDGVGVGLDALDVQGIDREVLTVAAGHSDHGSGPSARAG